MQEKKEKPVYEKAYIQSIGGKWFCYDCEKRFGEVIEELGKVLSTSLENFIDEQGIYKCGNVRKCPYDLVYTADQEVKLQKFINMLL